MNRADFSLLYETGILVYGNLSSPLSDAEGISGFRACLIQNPEGCPQTVCPLIPRLHSFPMCRPSSPAAFLLGEEGQRQAALGFTVFSLASTESLLSQPPFGGVRHVLIPEPIPVVRMRQLL